MKVLLLGATGMSGLVIKSDLENRGVEVIGVARSGADVNSDLGDSDHVEEILADDSFDAYINAAALTDIAKCEAEPLESWRINAKLVSILANSSQKHCIPLMQMSTDHYYDYGGDLPHSENDRVVLMNEYARHKYAAEAFALTSEHALVIRTSILGRRVNGLPSLVDWAIKSLQSDEELELFRDAWTSSIDVYTFSEIALMLLFDYKFRGLINVGSHYVYSKETLVRKLADVLGLNHTHHRSVSIRSTLNRPNCLGLDVTKAEQLLARKMPDLDQICRSLVAHGCF